MRSPPLPRSSSVAFGSGVAFLSFGLLIFQHDCDYSLELSTLRKERAPQPFMTKSWAAPSTPVFPPAPTFLLTTYVSATPNYLSSNRVIPLCMLCLPSGYLLQEVLPDPLGWVGCCQGAQGPPSLCAILSLISQFSMLSCYVPTRLNTFEGGTPWKDHGENK